MCLGAGDGRDPREGFGILAGTTLGGKQEPNRGFKALMKPLIKIRGDSAPLQGEACLGK